MSLWLVKICFFPKLGLSGICHFIFCSSHLIRYRGQLPVSLNSPCKCGFSFTCNFPSYTCIIIYLTIPPGCWTFRLLPGFQAYLVSSTGYTLLEEKLQPQRAWMYLKVLLHCAVVSTERLCRAVLSLLAYSLSHYHPGTLLFAWNLYWFDRQSIQFLSFLGKFPHLPPFSFGPHFSLPSFTYIFTISASSSH